MKNNNNNQQEKNKSRKEKIPDWLRAVLIIICTFIIVFFFESQKIALILSAGKDSSLQSIGISFASFAEKIKADVGLSGYFKWDESFWARLKISPVIFSSNTNQENHVLPVKPTATPQPTPAKIEPPFNILIVGDSFIAEKFGPSLEKKLLEFKDTAVHRSGIYSTGLSRPDYFDWNSKIIELISENGANVAIVMFGANDAQDLRTIDGKITHYGTSAWNNEYAERVDSFQKIMFDNGIKIIFWIGNPIARDDYYRKRMESLNSIYQTESAKNINILYIPTWNLLMDSNGKYSDYLTDEYGKQKLARAPDGIHTTSFGAGIMVNEVIKKIKTLIELESK